MKVVSVAIFYHCLIAHYNLFGAALPRNTKDEQGNGLSSASALKSSKGLQGNAFCKSASDCKDEKDQGCVTAKGQKSLGFCIPCKDETEVKGDYELDGCGGGLNIWVIVAIVIGVLLLAAGVISLVVCFFVPSCPLAKRRKNNQNRQYGQNPQADEEGQYQGQPGQYEGQPGEYQGQQGVGQPAPPPGYAYGQAHPSTDMAMPSNNRGRNDSGSGSGSGSGSSSGSYSRSTASTESVTVASGPGTKNPPKA